MTRSTAGRCAAVAMALTITGAAFAQHPHVLVPAEKPSGGQAPPALAAGAQISVIEGDPGQKGAITPWLQLSANYTFDVNPTDDPQRRTATVERRSRRPHRR